ncbi:MAG: 2-oxoacid:acceptor oxidoreductase subunit alpha [Candidatus Margulisiibacteriota bacterium]|jgi:2-oxoglutarate ferredoxin oxidoreductase subunit alpha
MFTDNVSIVLSGEAGQGLKTIESLCMTLLQKSGYNAFLAKEFMSRVRGGNNTTEIRVSSQKVYAFSDKIDILIVLGPDAIDRVAKRLAPGTFILGEKAHIDAKYAELGCMICPLEIEAGLKELGGTIYANNLINGLLCKLFSAEQDVANALISAQFKAKGEEVIAKNLSAFQKGMTMAEALPIKISIAKDPLVLKQAALSGTDAIGIGAIAGGCNFIASYPMSPSTGVLTYLAQKGREYGIVVEQAEDEIAAINMSLGAWYTGARGMVTTSGGGFALMTEGVSLAGCLESPAVIHLAQRPGPATGLPTRTEQGDLNLALYAGHGDFPRVIYAPGTLQDGILLTHKAFDVADRFQVPVFLLTDQYYLDSVGITDKMDLAKLPVEHHFIKTGPDYLRYKLTPSGLSPRGIPGNGDGLVCLDSDEHDESGRITEDAEMRTAMVDKRLKKLAEYIDVEPEIIGSPNYTTLVVGWGSTYGPICEALKLIGRDDIAFAYFKQVYPVPKIAQQLLAKAKTRILVENNATGQFGNLLKMETMSDFHKRILKYNGMQFSVEELVEQIMGAIK